MNLQAHFSGSDVSSSTITNLVGPELKHFFAHKNVPTQIPLFPKAPAGNFEEAAT